MDCGRRAIVPSIEGFQDIERFLAMPDFSDDEPIGSHAKRVLDQIGDVESALLGRLAGELA